MFAFFSEHVVSSIILNSSDVSPQGTDLNTYLDSKTTVIGTPVDTISPSVAGNYYSPSPISNLYSSFSASVVTVENHTLVLKNENSYSLPGKTI